jgi:hypothetical protein
LDYTQDEIDETLKKPEYLNYYQTRYLGDSIEYEYQKAFKEVENSKAEADKLITEKEQVDKEYSKEKTIEKKQEDAPLSSWIFLIIITLIGVS